MGLTYARWFSIYKNLYLDLREDFLELESS
jgi:hypothetical protein